jgi:quinolinate synthase
MKKITLPKVAEALRKGQYRIEIDAEIADGARRAIERMMAAST